MDYRKPYTWGIIFIGLFVTGLILLILIFAAIFTWWVIEPALVVVGVVLLFYLGSLVIDAVVSTVKDFVVWLRAIPRAVWESFNAWATRWSRRDTEKLIARIHRGTAWELYIDIAISRMFARPKGALVSKA